MLSVILLTCLESNRSTRLQAEVQWTKAGRTSLLDNRQSSSFRGNSLL